MERIVIVGAGLVGSLLSVYLARKGYKVDIYDRNPDMRQAYNGSGRAINLTLCDRGLKALDEVGIGETIRKISAPAYGRFVHSLNGELAYQPYGNNDEAIYSILRSDLSKALLDFAETHDNVDYHFNEKCTGIDLSPLSLEFKNSETQLTTTCRADRVFGADGAFSAIRTLMQRMHRFNYSQEFLDQGYKELRVPGDADASWMSEKRVLHMWPRGRYMLLGFPNMDGSFTCSLHMPFEGEPSFDSIRTREDVLDFFEETFPDVVKHIPNLAEDFNAHQPNPMITIRCSPWTFQGKVALIGDAAHVLYPYYGQGANSGFEDCLVLMQCMEKYQDNWNLIFSEYERLRKPNMDAISDMCGEHYVEIRDSLADPKFLLRKTIERRVNQLFPDRYTPLYSMIAFSCMPYADALRIDREQSRTIDELMKVEEIESKLNTDAAYELIERVLAPANGMSASVKH
ncbi:MAG: kynurenine 3-monooxygenase [Blastocatellia bacterium]|nr:kynurenine 3-monooxygenase [Blastocatellia bacterium]